MPPARTNAAISHLAHLMADNHIFLSVPKELRQEARDLLLKDRAAKDPQRAVVVVVGAGASTGVAGLPRGQEAVDLLKERTKIPKGFFDRELERLSIQYRLDKDDFETQLLALSAFDRSKLTTEMAKLFSRRFYAPYFYEFIAHLFKHRFIDCIINFNFDEILDESIAAEMGPENYRRIVSDGDVPDDMDSLQDEGRFRIPLYIKPHGTAGHPSSMRFTREAYFFMPHAMQKLLLTSLNSSPTALILIGFAMQSVEFSKIVEQAAGTSSLSKHPLTVFVVNRNREVLNRLPVFVDKHWTWQSGGLDEVADTLWKKIGSFFKPVQRQSIRGVERHKLIGSLFCDKVDHSRAENQRDPPLREYLKDRTVVELALAIAKAKGFVNIGQLSQSRAGAYFRHYRSTFPNTRQTLLALCEKLGLHQEGYSSDTLRLSDLTKRDLDARLIVSRIAWNQKARNDLSTRMINELSDSRGHMAARHRQVAMHVLDTMYLNEEIEVCNPVESPYDLAFRQPRALPSLTAMHIYTRKMLLKTKRWNRLFCIAETGEWLLNDSFKSLVYNKIKKGNFAVVLVVADTTFVPQLKRIYGARLCVAQLHWWLHNQHMTLILNRNVPQMGLYFERRLRSLEINPIGLEDDSDLEIAHTTFLAYWEKAKMHHGTSGLLGEKNLKAAKDELETDDPCP